jgi:hypothetical protein
MTKLGGKGSEASGRGNGDKNPNSPGKKDKKGNSTMGDESGDPAGANKSAPVVDPSDTIDLDVLTILRTLDVDFDDLTPKPSSAKRAKAPGRRPTTH